MSRASARLAVSCFVALAIAGPLRAIAADVEIAPPVGYVNDRANVMDEPSRAKLEAFLDQVHRKTGAQFAVLTVPTTAPLDPSDYKTKVFQAWGIGSKDQDDGLLLLVAIAERDAHFEVGYGLEGTLPDGFQSRVFRREMAPRFREGDYAGGINAGMLACAARLAKEKGVTLEWDGSELRYSDSDEGGAPIPPWVIALIVFFIISSIVGSAQRRGRRRGWGGWYVGPFGGGFGGGGFGGFGGGGFGGGGGGGGSFGGFGGGSSGGGGGGGKW